MTIAIYAVGAALLAVWFDARRPAPSLNWAFAHAAGAFLALQLLMPVLETLDTDEATSIRLVGVLLMIVLPAFAYSFFALCRLVRVLAELRR